jgi:hypothetical protein
MRAKYLGIATLAVLLAACKKNQSRISKVDLPELAKPYVVQAKRDTSKFIHFPLCKLVSSDWDQVSIIGPYMPSASMDSLNLTNISDIRDQIDSVIYREDKDLLVFSKAGIINTYVLAERRKIGFDFLVKSRPAVDGLSYVFDRSYCNKLVLKIDNTGSVIVTERSYIRKFAKNAELVIID